MVSKPSNALRVTYVTAALGSRLPLARELCCRSSMSRQPQSPYESADV
ncbi:hypothetical protein [Millisia brevis]|nr:hypothetical protein [Millisia brevis]